MAFKMTCDVHVEGYKPFKPSSFKWNRSVDNWCDSASFVIPGVMILKNGDNNAYSNLPSLKAFKAGLAVKIYGGYNGQNKLLFNGFISAVRQGTTAEVLCEGYFYKLKRSHYTLNISGTKLKDLIEQIANTKYTGIKISEQATTEINFPKGIKPFIGATAGDIFDYLKVHCGISVFFDFDKIYYGFRMAFVLPVAKWRLRWNVVSDSDLLYDKAEVDIVTIRMVSTNADGSKNIIVSTNNPKPSGETKDIKTNITDRAAMQKAANEKQLEYMRYHGSITGFLVPYAAPGMTAQIVDKKYPERDGQYFISAVEGSFSVNGGRQKITLDGYLGAIGKNSEKALSNFRQSVKRL